MFEELNCDQSSCRIWQLVDEADNCLMALFRADGDEHAREDAIWPRLAGSGLIEVAEQFAPEGGQALGASINLDPDVLLNVTLSVDRERVGLQCGYRCSVPRGRFGEELHELKQASSFGFAESDVQLGDVERVARERQADRPRLARSATISVFDLVK